MKTMLNTQNPFTPEGKPDVSGMFGKMLYERPVLIEYGTLVELTQTGGHGKYSDGGLFQYTGTGFLIPF